MSRIGRKPINIPAGVEVKIDGSVVTVKGPKGTLTQKFHPNMTITQEGNEILVTRPDDEKQNRSLHGLTRTLIHNMVVGVTEGYKKELDVLGVGYRVQKQGKDMIMNLGFSHNVVRSNARPRTRSSFPGRISRRSASSQRKCARSARRSRIRARVSATRTNTYAARKARPVRAPRSKE